MREGDYECVNGDEKCTVVLAELKGKKRICSRCRHLKCLAVGMSLHAVKTGRYTHSKRTQDILEYKQVMGQMAGMDSSLSNSSITTSSMAVSSTNNTPASSTVPSMPSEAHSSEAAYASFTFSAAFAKQEPVTFPSQDCDPPSQYVTLKPAQFSGGQSHSFGRVSFSNDNQWDGNPVSSLFGPPHWQSLLSESSFVDNMFNRMADAEPGWCDGSVSVSPECSSTSSPLSVSLLDSVASPSVDGVDMTDEECQALTQHILQSYTTTNFAKYTQSPEEILKKQRACYDDFQTRIEVFGQMKNLSEEEYQEVYQSTGIDVDNRQSFLSTVSKVMEESIHEYIKFAKGIPGFSQLCMKDKITLIRDNRAEVMAIAQTTGYNHELQVFALPSGRTFSMYDMERIGGKERQQVRCECLHAIQKLGLTKEERILFKCVVLFTVGRDDVEEPDRVSAMQWKMTQCLRWLLKQNKRPHPDIVFARIIAVFGRLREFAMIFYEWLKSKPFAHYAQFKQNELLAEWFSHS